MADVRQADADYYQAISKAVAQAHAKAVPRKAATYAKAKAAMPSPQPLPTAKMMRSVLERPEIHAHVSVFKRALDAQAMPIADMPAPPPGYDGIEQQITQNRKVSRDALAISNELNRKLKRRRDEPRVSQYKQIGDIAADATVLNAAISSTLENFMNENGFPDV